jgi:predicted metal-binding protein
MPDELKCWNCGGDLDHKGFCRECGECSEDICGECGQSRPGDERVSAGLKCGPCAY